MAEDEKADEAGTPEITGKIVLDASELKEVFGERLEIACLASEVKGRQGGVMIPANEPCPTNPHNHDAVEPDALFQKVIVLKF
jgi:hypothetical protein